MNDVAALIKDRAEVLYLEPAVDDTVKLYWPRPGECFATDGFPDPVDNLVLDRGGGRRRPPSRDILVEHTAKQIGDGCGGLTRSQDIAKEPAILRARVADGVAQPCERFFRKPLFGESATEDLLDFDTASLRGNRPIREILQIVGRDFQHAFRQFSKLFRGHVEKTHGR